MTGERYGARRLPRLLAAAVALSTVAAGAAAVAGVVPASGSPSTTSAAANGGADWTLMIYDVADTSNIAVDMIRNLAAFAALPEMANVNIVALVDLPERDDPGYPNATLPGIGHFTTTKLVVVEGGRYQEVRDLGETAMGRPDVLAGFIDEAADRFPADKYGLVLSDHGAAYSGGYLDTGPPGSTRMTVADMRNGMITGMQRAGIDRFELLDHDACLMASYEVASALAPLARTMVASEEVTFGDNTLSPGAISALGQNVSGEEWGALNIEQYAAWADRASPELGGFSALSVVDGDAMARLDRAVESFANVAAQHMDRIAPQVGQARAQALEFLVGVVGESQSESIVDLGDFLRHLEDLPPEVEVARDAVFAALDAAVLSQVTRRATEQATGLNVFFPSDRADARSYLDEPMGPPGWSRFVEAYVDARAQPGGGGGDPDEGGRGSANFTSEEARVLEKGKGGIKIAGTLSAGDEANVTQTETQVFTRLEGRDVLAVALPAYLNAGGVGQVQGVWNYSVTSITDGRRSLPVSAIYQAQSGGLIGSMWADYRRPGGDVTTVAIRVLLDTEGRIVNVSVADANGDGSAGVSLQVGGSLRPHFIVNSSGNLVTVRSSRSIRVTENIRLDYPQFRAGTRFLMGVVVADLAGGSDGAFVNDIVPRGRTQ